MSANWPVLTLDNVCEKITDGAHKSPKSVSIGRPMASVKDLTRFGVDLSQARLISQKDFEDLVNQGCQPQVGDVLIAKDGNSALDTVCTVDKPLDAVMLSSVAILRPNKTKLDSDFLKYYFCSRDVIEYLKNNFISGAAIPRVVLRDFKKAVIKVPSLKEQKRISKVLCSLDNKIELNHQINQTLEQMAQALFKSWFVDFDPVQAKMTVRESGGTEEQANLAAMQVISGKTEVQLELLKEQQPKQYDELKATAELFPNAMQESELGDVPVGWGVTNVESILELAYGKALKKTDRKKGKIPVYGSGGLTGFHNEALVEGTGIIVGRKGTVGSIYWEDKSFFPIDTVFYVKPKQGFNLEFIYYFLQTLGLNTMNTDAAVPGLNRNNVYRLETSNIPRIFVNEFSKFVIALRAIIKNNSSNTHSLIQVRDTLLPKLISGELNINKEGGVS